LHYIKKEELQANFLEKLAASVKMAKKNRGEKVTYDNSEMIIDFFKVNGVLHKKAKLSNTPSITSVAILVNYITDDVYPTLNGAWFSNFITIYPERHQETKRVTCEF
jgi:hypothetical protein